jgi:hypothetical protein
VVQVYGTFTASLRLQVKLPGGDWQDVGSAITAPGIYEVAETCSDLRVNTTAYTSGTPQAIFGGFNERD